jgi:hypothetical protein
VGNPSICSPLFILRKNHYRENKELCQILIAVIKNGKVMNTAAPSVSVETRNSGVWSDVSNYS